MGHPVARLRYRYYSQFLSNHQKDASHYSSPSSIGIIVIAFRLLAAGWYPHDLGPGAHAALFPGQPSIAGRRACLSVQTPLTIGTRSVNCAKLDGDMRRNRLE
jgi:hypothetical protein